MRRLLGAALLGTAALALVSAGPTEVVRPLSDAGLRAMPAQPASVTATSPNWVGYAINTEINTAVGTGGYTSVAASWVQPAVDCAKGDGTVVFWVGLDGWGTNAVEQNGTQASCTAGTAHYAAWWETYPTNSITVYPDTVEPGDRISARVDYVGVAGYELYLSDPTRGWTEHGWHAGSTAATNRSAEIVAETPIGANGNLAALPDFGAIRFSGARINGDSLSYVDALGVNLVRDGDLLALTSELANGTAFTITWERRS